MSIFRTIPDLYCLTIPIINLVGSWVTFAGGQADGNVLYLASIYNETLCSERDRGRGVEQFERFAPVPAYDFFNTRWAK